MVLLHKLKQSETLDLSHFRHFDQEEAMKSPAIKPRAVSPPRRPQTRSQSGGSAKRHIDFATHTVTKKPKLQRRTPKKKSGKDLSDFEDDEPPSPPPTPKPKQKETKFIQADPSIQPEPSNRPGPRTRISIPVPVPNLTKKSRGRRVPTNSIQGDVRKYVCQVEDCGKCFHRGEHLKRHIRSIHTNEKPFKCTEPTCDKSFNRHDNLLQHVKVHTQEDEATKARRRKAQAATSSDSSLGSSSTLVALSDTPADNDQPTDEEQEPDQPPPPAPPAATLQEQVQQQQQYMLMMPFGVRMNPEAPTAGFVSNNMAVSSLRTEIVDSQPKVEVSVSPVVPTQAYEQHPTPPTQVYEQHPPQSVSPQAYEHPPPPSVSPVYEQRRPSVTPIPSHSLMGALGPEHDLANLQYPPQQEMPMLAYPSGQTVPINMPIDMSMMSMPMSM